MQTMFITENSRRTLDKTVHKKQPANETGKRIMQNIKNFWKLEDRSFFHTTYLFVDHGSFQADSVLNQEKIRVKLTQKMSSEDTPYCLLLCKVRNRDCEKFESAMEKLKKKMLLCGFRDYEGYCREVTAILEPIGG